MNGLGAQLAFDYRKFVLNIEASVRGSPGGYWGAAFNGSVGGLAIHAFYYWALDSRCAFFRESQGVLRGDLPEGEGCSQDRGVPEHCRSRPLGRGLDFYGDPDIDFFCLGRPIHEDVLSDGHAVRRASGLEYRLAVRSGDSWLVVVQRLESLCKRRVLLGRFALKFHVGPVCHEGVRRWGSRVGLLEMPHLRAD